METKIIVFEYQEGFNKKQIEEIEFDIDASEDEIQQHFEDWVWGLIGDKVTWFEK